LTKGALGVMVDVPLTFANLPELFMLQHLSRWLPGVLFGLILYLILRRNNHFLILPGAILVGTILFYAYIFLAGISISQASAGGWMLGPFPEGGLFKLFTLQNLAQVQWR